MIHRVYATRSSASRINYTVRIRCPSILILIVSSPLVLRIQPGNYLDFNQTAGKSKLRNADRSPCRVGGFHITIFDLHESRQVLLQTDMECGHLDNIVERNARGREDRLQCVKRLRELRFRIRSNFTVRTDTNYTRTVEPVTILHCWREMVLLVIVFLTFGNDHFFLIHSLSSFVDLRMYTTFIPMPDFCIYFLVQATSRSRPF